MTHLTVDKDALRKFIQSFGHNVHDLMLRGANFTLMGSVAMPTNASVRRSKNRAEFLLTTSAQLCRSCVPVMVTSLR